MIFVTIGSMVPFDRLIKAVDVWCEVSGEKDVFAQIGTGKYQPRHMRWIRRLSQGDFVQTVQEATLLISHAGMGTIITAGQYGKPVVMMPRQRTLGEHNTDHQLATVKWLSKKPGIYVVGSEQDLSDTILQAMNANNDLVDRISPVAPSDFINRINDCLDGFGG